MNCNCSKLFDDSSLLKLNITHILHFNYQQGLKLAQKDGNKELATSLKNLIDDIQTQTQRMVIGIAIALLLTGISYGALVTLSRRNEAKYLQQLTKQNVDSIDLI